jgi:hypothetical protein
LADALQGANIVDVGSVDTAKIKFTAGNATIYQIAVPRNAGCATNNANIVVTQGGCNGNVDAAGNNLYIVSGFAAGDEIELLIEGVEDGDKVVITPMNDYCLAGDVSTDIVLHDNVAPTTVLQESYGLGNDTNGSAGTVSYGDGGELAGIGTDATVGTPYLAITAGLLDNLDANGNQIMTVGMNGSDNTLDKELIALNTKYDDDDDDATPDVQITNAYDTLAWASMKRERTMGVAFSENINLIGIPSVSNIDDATLSGWKANNDVRYKEELQADEIKWYGVGIVQ